MSPDLAVIIVAALPYADKWVGKVFTDLPKRRKDKLAKAKAGEEK